VIDLPDEFTNAHIVFDADPEDESESVICKADIHPIYFNNQSHLLNSAYIDFIIEMPESELAKIKFDLTPMELLLLSMK